MDPSIILYVIIGCVVTVLLVVMEIIVRCWLYFRRRRIQSEDQNRPAVSPASPERSGSVSTVSHVDGATL